MAYSRLEPFGEERADLRSAIVASVMANAWRGKDSKAFSPEDFMPFHEKPELQQTDDEQKNIFSKIKKAIEQRDKRNGDSR